MMKETYSDSFFFNSQAEKEKIVDALFGDDRKEIVIFSYPILLDDAQIQSRYSHIHIETRISFFERMIPLQLEYLCIDSRLDITISTDPQALQYIKKLFEKVKKTS